MSKAIILVFAALVNLEIIREYTDTVGIEE
jgi:hypothetical protein